MVLSLMTLAPGGWWPRCSPKHLLAGSRSLERTERADMAGIDSNPRASTGGFFGHLALVSTSCPYVICTNYGGVSIRTRHLPGYCLLQRRLGLWTMKGVLGWKGSVGYFAKRNALIEALLFPFSLFVLLFFPLFVLCLPLRI